MPDKDESLARLGNQVSKYEGRSPTGPFLMFLLGVLLVVAGIWAFMDINIPMYVRSLIVAGGIIIIASLDGLIKALRDYNLTVFEQGFEYSTMTGSRLVRWEDIVAVWQAVHTRSTQGPITRVALTLMLKDKSKITLDNERFKKMEALGKTIQREVTRQMMPQYAQTINSGGTARFGKLAINNQGISNGENFIPWERVKQVQIKNGVVAIWTEGKWLTWSSVLASEIPNLFVFLSLVDQIVGVRS